MKYERNLSELVYSTNGGTVCTACGNPQASCVCRSRAAAAVPKGDGTVRVGCESKGRGGKVVSVVTGVPLPAGQLGALAKTLRKKCGSGGTVKNGTIELQGDHRELLVTLLWEQGYRVKKTGG
ncbi:MAG: translation initiation factor Sui1 [Chitinispirillaceae bacterium]|nr:translation initiation factor Sui1 [Chitinispirillaceae bacterium]